jgi:hypothetical protein
MFLPAHHNPDMYLRRYHNLKFRQWDNIVVFIVFCYKEVTGSVDQPYRNIQYVF